MDSRRGPRGSFLLIVVSFLVIFASLENALVLTTNVRRFHFKVDYLNVTRLCQTKPLVAVNGRFPGPAQYVNEGDKVIVTVTNLVSYNLTIHWHGLKQKFTSWADGPAYVTQCPIQTGHSYTHIFRVTEQRGTLWWHAHITWLRATVHGAFIVLPVTKPHQSPYPFPTPHKEVPLILGEWWNANVQDVEAIAVTGANGYNLSDALTINGQPGDFYNCSKQDTFVVKAKEGETYLLRIINAALNFQLWFGVANHTITVVEADAEYTKPYTTDVVVIAPGQTASVLLTATQKCGNFYMASFPYSPPLGLPYPHTAATAIFQYQEPDSSQKAPSFPDIPAANDTRRYTDWNSNILSLNSIEYPTSVPLSINRNLFFTVGYAREPCSSCQSGLRLQGSVNNVTFRLPAIAILQAFLYNLSGVFTTDFPSQPPFPFNYTGPAPANPSSEVGTRVSVLEFGDQVELVLQDQSILFFENHPFHLHGQSFYIVGTGVGNFQPHLTSTFNLLDPPLRNTVGVPYGGWAALRFKATNPGAWLLHCHIEVHTSWGMEMVFITKNGVEPDQKLPLPPSPLPPC